MDILIFIVLLSQCWRGSTHITTDGNEASSQPFAFTDSTEPQSVKLLEITTDSERSSLNFASTDSRPTAIVSDLTTSSLNFISSDDAVTNESKMTEASKPDGRFGNAKTHFPEESLTVSQTLAWSQQGNVVPTATVPAETHPEVIRDTEPKTRNRSPRQTYSSGSTSANQNIDPKKASFETTRGKNWCAYVHTRLAPSVTADSVETFISAVKDPCGMKNGGCPIRYQMVTRPAYRMRHKIVTSLEWKCCPGYSGEKCQLIARKYPVQKHENQAESNNAINGGASGDPQQISPDPALTQKMSDQIYKQDMKLTSLQKKVDNISSTMNEFQNTLSSLEGKINEDNPGKSVQSFLKGLKSKTITELVKDIVREQMKGFQTDMQETVAQLFKTISGLSVEVESTRETIKHLNETVVSLSENQKLFREQEPMPTMGDILDLKNHILHVKEDITSECGRSLKELQESHASLASELEREQSRSNMYYESLNKTLSKMREVHDQLLCDERAQVPNVPTMDASTDDNVTEYLLTLQDKVKRQSFMMLQLYQDISAQDSKINNFTITLELQKESIQRVCEARFSKCRKDFENKIRSTEENVHVLNKTMSDVVLPLDDKLDKMNEQINDLCYDMEILQPLIEQGAPFSMTPDYDRQNDVATVNKQLEELSAVINSLTINVRELAKDQEGLRSEAESRDQVFEQRIDACLVDIEDGLNNTMMVLNNAVDSIQDNYVLKETMLSLQNDSQLLNQTVHKLDTLLGLIPQLRQLNESVRILVHNNLQQQKTFNSTDDLSSVSLNELSKDKSADLVAVFHIVNETTAKVDQCLQNVSQLEQKLDVSAQEKIACEARLQNVESQITEILANCTLALKPKKVGTIAKEKEQPAYPKYQELNSRVRALELKSIRLSSSMPLLNKTVYETQGLCQKSFVSITSVNASIPLLIRNAQPNITILQQFLKELVISATDGKTEALWSNVTAYMNRSTADVISNVAKLQKQMKLVIKKSVPVKTTSTNVTSTLVGRNQRNTDNVAEQDDTMGCSNAPCLNGGTCINDRDSFVCACRHPFGGVNCSIKMADENTLAPDFSKGSYRYAPMVTFFVSHTYGMTTPGPIKFNNLYVNYGASYAPRSGKFIVPYLGVYVFKYTIESFSPRISGYLVVDGIDKLAFQSENVNSSMYSDRVVTGDALLELNYGQEVWLRLAAGSIPSKYPPVTTFGGFLLYRT